MGRKRTIEGLGIEVSSDVIAAINLLESRYGAADYRDSGHTKTSPTWILELPRYGAEVGVRMNKSALSLYMRNRTLDGRKLTDLLDPTKIHKVYPRDGKPAQSILVSPFLGPRPDNECVLLSLQRSDLEPLFESFFATPASGSTSSPGAAVSPSWETSSSSPPIDAATFDALLERRSEIGAAGELVVVLDEIRRLEQLGCPDPDRWVERVALADVGRGYDIASTWPGYERCIEVKSSTSTESDLFITENERQVLSHLGPKAWLYRVRIRVDGSGEIALRVQDPIRKIPPEAYLPVAYRVGIAAIRDADVKA